MVLRAGFHGTVGQSSAQVIDGSLKFDSSNTQYLKRTPGSAGNRRTWTMSWWQKRSSLGVRQFVFEAGNADTTDGRFMVRFSGTDESQLMATRGQAADRLTSAIYRDFSGWAHYVVAVDTTATGNDKIKIYKDGTQIEIGDFSSPTNPGDSANTAVNMVAQHTIGYTHIDSSHPLNSQISQYYLIDGQALGPEYFGFTDPLTNTWRPKKFSGSFTGPGDNVDDWIGMTTGTQFNASTSIDEAFDGVSNSFAAATGNSYFTFTPTTPITGITNVRLTVQRDNSTSSTIELNDVDISSSWSAGTTATVTFARTTLSKVKWGTDGSNQWFSLAKIEVEKNGVYYTLIHGKNGFYLPMDGNSPIGQDKSGKGNDWTPVNFGGSNSLEKATGALPILNTTQGGTQVGVDVRTDSNSSNLVLALPLIGNIRDVHHRIKGSGSAKSVTGNGNVVANYSFSNFYGGSYYFDGSGDSLTVASSSDLGMGTGDFTIEAWVHPTQLYTANFIVCLSGSDSVFGYGNDGTLNIQLPASGAPSLTQLGPKITNNEWNHFACVRESGNLRAYVNGVLAATVSNATTNMGASGTATIGNHPSLSREIKGYLQDVRIYKGVAKYNSNFIPASTNPDILPDTPSGVSGGSKLTKVTDGGVVLGSNGHLTVTDSSSSFNPGTGDFAIEGYFRFPDNSGTRRAFVNDTGTFGNNSLVIRQYNTGFEFYCGGTSFSDSGYNMAQWNHAMVTRSGSTARFFVNGELRATRTTSQSISCEPTNQMTIGGYYNNGEFMNGHASNLRLTVGSIPTDYQTSSTTVGEMIFTPSSVPLTSTSQGANSSHVKLLCCQSNTSATAAAVKPSTTSILEPFSGAGGAQGSGTTSDYLSVSSSGHSDFSLNGDFTVEWWHYRAAANANNGFMWTIHDSNTSTGLELYWGSGGSQLKLYTNGGPNNVTATSATGWHHYAVVRSGSTIKVYYDGTEGVSITNSNTFSGDVRIGAEYYNGGITGGMDGPMSQFRLVKGTAVYTSNFTPPGTALTAITNTKLLTLQGSTPFSDASGTGKTITINGSVFSKAGEITAGGGVEATNFNPFNTDINTVRGQETGYATLNPLAKGNDITLSQGNLHFSSSTVNGFRTVLGTIGMSSGKWYCEVESTNSSSDALIIGIALGTMNVNTWLGGTSDSWGYYEGGTKYHNSSGSNYGSVTFGVGDTMGITFDADNGTLTFYKNGINLGNAYTGLSSDTYFFAVSDGGTTTASAAINFGQKPFKFPPPDGFQPLNAANVRPEKVITRPDQYVGVATYTGSGATRPINIGLQPDLVWIKQRNAAVENQLFDSVRGPGKRLQSDTSNSEYSASNLLSSFNSDGFTLEDSNFINGTTSAPRNYVAWSWKAGGSKGVFNVDGVGYANASDVNMNVGGLNSSIYNQSQTWSNSLTISGSWDSGGVTPANAFDGLLSTNARAMGQNQQITFDITSTPLTFTDKVELYTSSSGMDVSVNGGTVQVPATNQFVTIASGGGTLNTITFLNANAKTVVTALRVDGKLLVDPNAITTPSVAATGCSVGTRQGFSIIQYAGTNNASTETIPHGLSQKPDFMIVKQLTDNSTEWIIYHSSLGATKYLLFDATRAGTNSGPWGNTEPTSSVFTVGSGYNNTNRVSRNFISYHWHSVPGLQKFGTYEGNESTNGPFIELGFRPAMVMVRNADENGNDWKIYDGTRNPHNVVTQVLYPNLSNSEDANTGLDFLSNGFKLRDSGSAQNGAETIVYAAWAEAPSFNLYGAQSNAR